MKSHHVLDVELTVLGPLLTKGGHTAEPGIDAPLARNSEGQFILPYSLVKGKVLDALLDLNTAEAFRHEWLGQCSYRGDDPERGRLRFSDFVTTAKGANATDTNRDAVIERIKIDDKSGSVEHGMLAMVEAPFGYGEPVTFKGRVEFVADDAEAKLVKDELTRAFREVPAFGAMRTVGFGRHDSDKLKLTPRRAEPTLKGTIPDSDVLPFHISLDRPLCVVGPKHNGNHFDSLPYIPGAVLKGAVARLLQEVTGHTNRVIDGTVRGFPALGAHFEKVRFAEAVPMANDATERPVVPPRSLVASAEHPEQYADAALWHDDKCKLIHDRAPLFQIDWKQKTHEAVAKEFGTTAIEFERRTRTAMDRDKGRSKDQQLFSYGLVVQTKLVWEGAIGLELVPESQRTAVCHELNELLKYGVPNVGKTRATGSIQWLKAPTAPKIGSHTPPDGEHVVTLQTECLMTDPDVLQGDGLGAAYREFWREASGGALQLVRYFAAQVLHGGHIVRRGRASGSKYEPFLVTDRGSAFVLKELDAANAKELLAKWERYGLPAAKWVQTRYGSDSSRPLWQVCPFLPHVGFGAVAVDLACHTERSKVK